MKRVFTLMEILIVVIIIWIILIAFWYLSWNYFLKFKFYSQLSKFEDFYYSKYSQSLWLFEKNSYTWMIYFESWSNKIFFYVYSGLDLITGDILNLDNVKISKINCQWNSFLSGYLIINSYKLGVIFKTASNLYKSWDLKLCFKWYSFSGCRDLVLDIGKLY